MTKDFYQGWSLKVSSAEFYEVRWVCIVFTKTIRLSRVCSNEMINHSFIVFKGSLLLFEVNESLCMGGLDELACSCLSITGRSLVECQSREEGLWVVLTGNTPSMKSDTNLLVMATWDLLWSLGNSKLCVYTAIDYRRGGGTIMRSLLWRLPLLNLSYSFNK